MGTLHELRSQIDQGNTAILSVKNNNADVKIYIRKDVQGQYTHTISYSNRPNPFPQPRTQPYSSWEHLLEDIDDLQATSDQWSIE